MRVLPRTNFHSSELLRCLADIELLAAAEPAEAFVEKLGEWMHFTDAIALSAAHDAGWAKLARAPAGEDNEAVSALEAEFARIQVFLSTSVKKSCAPKSVNAHIKLPLPPLELPANLTPVFAEYRRFYEAHQRDMELSIRPLRFNTREALAKASPALRKLAELDIAFERILREREGKLLGRVPALLKKRFELLAAGHRQAQADAALPDNPNKWTQPGGWLANFIGDMQMLLLAEVALRLQPTAGLIDAYKEQNQHA